jgi:predicted dehydrogenase
VWQTQPWVASRRQGGPLYEVGTHYVFGILESLGLHLPERREHHVLSLTPTDLQLECQTVYPDGPDGTQCESSCDGSFVLGYTLLTDGEQQQRQVRVEFHIESTSEEAVQRGKDIYELHVIGSEQSLVLYDFTRLKVVGSETDLVVGTYGRKDFVQDLITCIRANSRDAADIVTPQQAANCQRIISALKRA